MPDLIPRLCALVLAGVFAWSALAKTLRWPQWRQTLRRYRFPRSFEALALAGAPAAEGVVVGLIVLGHPRAGSALALALLASFCLAVVRARRVEGDRLPCGCFGRTKTTDFRTILARNAFLALLALVVVVQGEDVSLLNGLQAPSLDEAVPALLVVAGAVAAVWAAVSVTSSFRKGS